MADAKVMEAEASTVPETDATIVMQLSPEEIAINPMFLGLRGEDATSEDYVSKVKEIARLIDEENQKAPVLVRLNTMKVDGVSYELVDGHRRLDAIKLLRAAGGDNKDLKVLARFEDLDDNQALRAAAILEFQKQSFNPIARAKFMELVRERFKFPYDAKGTRKVAAFLGVDQATVSEYAKLLLMGEDDQAKVKSGAWSVSTALELARVKPEKRKEVEAQARKEAVKETVKEAEKATKTAEESGKQHHKEAAAKKTEKAEKATKGEVKVEAKHVRAASRKVEGAVKKVKTPNKAEIVGKFEEMSGPAYPKVLAAAFGKVVDWAEGKCGDKSFTAAWDDVADELVKLETKKAQAEREKELKKIEEKETAAKDKPTKKAAAPKAKKQVKKAKAKK